MIDLIKIRKNKEEFKFKMRNRGENFDLELIDMVVDFDEKRRSILVELEKLNNKKNNTSSEIPKLKNKGVDITEIVGQMKVLSEIIKKYDLELKEINNKIKNTLLKIPNVPNELVPEGDTDQDNVEIKRWGNPKKFTFEPKEHWTLGTENNLLDFERAGKTTGSRFTFYKGLGARLERALINYFLDKYTIENGYSEVLPPYMVNRDSMVGTGQLPKFEDEAFKVKNTEYFLIPTAEVPVTNIYRDEVLDGDKLPIKYAAYSACFRSEAGSSGRDTRGLIRQHQFNKVELVKFVRQEDSYRELDALIQDVEGVLQELGLPYRIVRICRGDLGFAAALKYDIEVWMPSYNKYVEISSCSNFEDFQARRSNIKYKDNLKAKPKYVHTLNGSGVAVGRALAAILENYQNEDGSICVPEVLRTYMRCEIIGK